MRTKKALLNIISSGLYQVVSIVCGLIVPRLILTHYGSTYNGVYASITQILGMISILTLGLAGATRVELYKTLANNDVLGTSRIMKATKNFMHKVGIALLCFAALLLVTYPFISHNDLAFWENDLLILIVCMSVFGEYYFALPNKTLLMADQTGYIAQNVYTTARITETLLTVFFVGLGCSIFIVKGASSLVFLLAPIALNIYVRQRYKLIKDCEPDETGIKNRGAVMFHSIANIVHNNSDVVLLTLFSDAKVLSVYSVYYLVLGKMKSIMQIFTNGLEAAFGNMWVKGEMDTLRRRFAMCEHGLYCFVGIVFSCVGVLIIPFIKLYTSGVTDINYIIYSFAILATLTEAIYCIREPYLILVQAAGKYEETKIGAAVEAGINLALSLILIKPLGINGVIIGTLVANVFRTVQYALFASKNILNISIFKNILKAVWLVATVGIVILFYIFVGSKIAISTGWIGWIIQSLIVFAVACVVVIGMSFIFYKDCIDQLISVILKRRPSKA